MKYLAMQMPLKPASDGASGLNQEVIDAVMWDPVQFNSIRAMNSIWRSFY
jgi:hypothetical protein